MLRQKRLRLQPKTLIFAALLPLSCGEAGPEADACGASGLADVIGQPLAAVTWPADLNTRVIPPGTAVTFDFVPDRLNVRLDADGNITGLDCG